MRILVTGGTGLLGRLVVDRLSGRGDDVVVLSRRARVGEGGSYGWATADLRSGVGVAEALAGADVVVHCATAFGRRGEVRIARTLVEAARAVGGPHLVYVSIVGVDRVPLPYYLGKLGAEEVISGAGLPHTILRATQFHQLLRALFAKAARTPLMPVPDFRFQPIDAGEVADRLAELALGAPGGRVDDLAGPEVRHGRDLARAFLRAAGRKRVVLPVRLPGKAFRAYRDGGHLAPEHAAGAVTFEEYLAASTDPASTSYRRRA